MPKTDATTKHSSELLIAQFLANPISETLKEISGQLHTFEDHKIFFDNLMLKAPEESFAAIKSFFTNTIKTPTEPGSTEELKLQQQQIKDFYVEKILEIDTLDRNDELSLRDTSTPTEIRGAKSPQASVGNPSFDKANGESRQGR